MRLAVVTGIVPLFLGACGVKGNLIPYVQVYPDPQVKQEGTMPAGPAEKNPKGDSKAP